MSRARSPIRLPQLVPLAVAVLLGCRPAEVSEPLGCGLPEASEAPALAEAYGDPLESVLYPPTLKPKRDSFLTNDLCGLPNQDSVVAYAWQEFIALNWPADPDGSGQPDREVKASHFGDPDDLRATTWETWRTDTQTFLPDGERPPPWGDDARQVPAGCEDIGDMSSHRVLTSTSKISGQHLRNQLLSSIDQPIGGWLTDQHGKLVWYERLMNRDEFEYIVDKKLYDSRRQQHVARSEGISFPFGLSDYGWLGSFEIKAAWKQLSPDERANGRFHLSRAVLQLPGTDTCQVAVVGLVGLHIVHKTPTFPSWVWATFEQVDNAPLTGQGKHPRVVPWSFFDPHCPKEKGDYTTNADRAPLRCAVNRSPIQGTQPAQKHPDGPIVVGDPMDRPIQVERIYPIPAAVAALNEVMQDKIRTANPDSVWQYYQLVDVEWPVDPATNAQLTAPGAQVPLQTYSMSSPGFQTPVANTTLETYVQQLNCTHCHRQATISAPEDATTSTLAADYSFLLLSAHPSK